MFHPKLSASFLDISKRLDKEVIDAIINSEIYSLELAYAGFEDNTFNENKEYLKECVADHRLKITSIHMPFGETISISSLNKQYLENAEKELQTAIEQALYFGADVIVVHASLEPIDPKDRKAMILQAGNTLKKYEQEIIENNLKIAVEFLPRTCIGNSAEELLAIIKGLDKEHFGVCLDVNHLMADYKRLPDIVLQLQEHLFELHLSDYDGIDEKHWLPGRGVIDWQRLIMTLNKINYKGIFNFEAHVLPGDTYQMKIQNLEDSFKWLTSLQSL